MNSLLIITGIATIAIATILKDMCKTPNVRRNINIEHETPPKYEDIEIVQYKTSL